MTMLIDRETFLSLLESVSPGLSIQHKTVAQSSSFVFREDDLLTYNGEIYCRHRNPIEGFTGAVPAVTLLGLLQKLPDKELDITPNETHLLIAGQGRRAKLVYEAEISLPVDGIEKPDKWVRLREGFLEAIQMAHECTGKGTFELTCVHIHPKWVEASNNIQIFRHKLKTGISIPTLLKGTSVKHVAALGMIRMAETDTRVFFKNAEGLVIGCTKYVMQFPNYAAFMEIEGDPLSLPSDLARASERAEVLSSQDQDVNLVTVEIKPGKLRLKGRSALGEYEEREEVPSYKGQHLSFMISPELLTKIVTKHNECLVSRDKLFILGEEWMYVTCLVVPT